MGQSKSIEELAASETKFENYLTERRKELEAKTAETRAQMDKDIEKFYKDGGWDDRMPVASASYYDIQVISEWSLSSVNKIITAISGAIFGSNNTPTGTTITNNISNNDTIAKIPSLQLLILSKAFSAIQGILEAFTLKSSITITQQHKIEVIAPGLTVFVYVNSNSFQNKSFFNNEIITQYFYVIDSFISKKQLGDYAVFEDLRLFEEEKSTLRGLASKVLSKMEQLDDISKLDVFTNMLDGLYERLDQVQERINELMKEEAQTSKQKIGHLRHKLISAKTVKEEEHA